VDLGASVQTVCQKATFSRPFEFKVVSIEGAQHCEDANCRFLVENNRGSYKIHLRDARGTVSEFDRGDCLAIAKVISNNAFTENTYPKAKTGWLFEKLYDVADRPINYLIEGTPQCRLKKTAPCFICGIVLPIENLTVDHERPQTGGGYEAVAKTFRAFGLTKEGPKGQKGQKILAHLYEGTEITPAKVQIDKQSGGVSLHQRYTLNEKGTLLYSLVVASGERENLVKACLHGVMNLKPACGSCNSSRGQKLKF
jgi:hypothetical protein